jgi:hypothetical protein
MQTIYRFSFCFFILLLSYTISIGQCIEDSHSPFEEQGWLSCTERTNPNTFRTPSHWLLYDLGYAYPVKSFYFWNHNVWGETGMGIKDVAVDYSIDKVNWIPLDTFQIEKAAGSWKYTGIESTGFDEVTGQYFLFTVLETWDGLASCAGLGEIKFKLGEVMTSTEDPELEAGFVISPNPVSDWVNIRIDENMEADVIYLYSSIGHRLAQIKPSEMQELKFDVQSLNAGLYFITLVREGKQSTQSFVKME